jgi:hypothetical protein
MTILGKIYQHTGKILIKAERVEYDGYHCEWKQHIEGEAYCSNPDEAIDTLSNLLAEYAANPITKGRMLSGWGESYRDGGPHTWDPERYRTTLLQKKA